MGRNTTHGLTVKGAPRKPEYTSWNAMKQRCSDPRCRSYPRYGGRGITVCERWLGKSGFSNFLADMGEKPSASHSIDRIDNDKGYSPENCRWASNKSQSVNKSTNSLVTFRGKTQCVSEWALELGIDRQCLRDRLFRYGWSLERAMTASPKPRFGDVEYKGEVRPISEWSRITGVPYETLKYRIRHLKWPVEKAMIPGPPSEPEFGDLGSLDHLL